MSADGPSVRYAKSRISEHDSYSYDQDISSIHIRIAIALRYFYMHCNPFLLHQRVVIKNGRIYGLSGD